ncbi:MAG: hypothetical protein ACRD4R_14675 [Candidatus Acidiferrales bacterium]
MFGKSVLLGGILTSSMALLLIAHPRPVSASPSNVTASVGAANTCDRACLEGFVNQYLDALAANDPSRLPVTQSVKYTEDGQQLSLGDGLWNTATGRGTYKFYMEDPAAGEVGFFGTMREAGEPIILALRLKIDDRKIAEIETIAVRDVQEAKNMEKRGHTDPLFMKALPPAERVSRADLVRTANLYFSGMQLDDGKGDYSFFANDCDRAENGSEATNNRVNNNGSLVASQGNSVDKDSRERSDLTYSASWGCKEQFQSGLLHFVTRIRDRRFVVVDPERGVALAFAFFDHASGRTRTFKLPNGRTITSGPTTPWTWEIAEVFKVERGKIHRIEAVYHRAPYGMNSGWSTWRESMSTLARWAAIPGQN